MSWCWLRENKRIFSLQVFSGVLTCSCHFWVRGNISRVSPLSKCCRQREILDRNPFSLSLLERKFSPRPCIRALSSFRYANVSAMYASRAHHSSLASSFASSNLFSSVKNIFNSSLNLYTRAKTFPRDNHRTCRLFRGLVLVPRYVNSNA